MRARNIIIAVLVLCSAILFCCAGYYNYQMSATGTKDTIIKIEIPSGTSVKGIGDILEKNGLIHSASFFKLYVSMFQAKSLKAASYELNKGMGLEEILDVLSNGNSYNPDAINITIKEGLNIRQVATAISKETNITYDDFINKVKDKDYINTLIDEYWFLDSVILNEDIYYPLEGYLFPDTYELKNKDVTSDEVIRIMLKRTDEVLSKYKKDFNNRSVHEILTMSSLVELEGTTDEYRSQIAGVFYNRLDVKMNLGSDVTTYYAFQVDLSERDLTVQELNTYNPYNTRGPRMLGKLPVGAICNPGEASIKASVYPSASDYLFFVADKYRNVYFTKTTEEHQKKVNEIKAKGDWITW